MESDTAPFLLLLALTVLGAILARSGFLIGMSCFVIVSYLGGTSVYTQATYFVAIREPAVTALVCSACAIGGLALSRHLEFDFERLALIFARTHLIFVNIALWIGSLWGSRMASFHLSAGTFAFIWGVGIIGVGLWGASAGRRFVVNTAASFGTIHIYTQWFERFGANPASLLMGGVFALGVMYLFRLINEKMA